MYLPGMCFFGLLGMHGGHGSLLFMLESQTDFMVLESPFFW